MLRLFAREGGLIPAAMTNAQLDAMAQATLVAARATELWLYQPRIVAGSGSNAQNRRTAPPTRTLSAAAAFDAASVSSWLFGVAGEG